MSKIEAMLKKYICMKIEALKAKNKNNPLIVEIIDEIAREQGCE